MSPSKVEKLAKRVLPRAVRIPLRYLRFRLALQRQTVFDFFHGSQQGGIPIPPPLLRYRVQGGVVDANNFLNVGLNCMQDIRSVLRRFGRELHTFKKVLDFGCGCGRIMRWLYDLPESVEIRGTDIDKKAIAWCKKSIPFANFDVNDPLPPFSYKDHCFDLIIGVSVLDHLDRSYQEAWIKELHRVTEKDGILLITFLGRLAQRFLDEDERERVEKESFLFKEGITGFFKLDGLPDFYQATFQTKENVIQLCSPHFEVLDYVEGGLGNYEDLVVLKRVD